MTHRGEFDQMNAAAVRRHDPYMAHIVDSATQVALYKYNVAIGEWEKTEIQGALFVYKRSGAPFHSAMILNRLSANNHIQPLIDSVEFQPQPPFLLFRTGDSEIFGLWFFYESECSRLAALMQRVCRVDADTPPAPASSASTQQVDLLSLITRAAGVAGDERPSKLSNGATSGGCAVNHQSVDSRCATVNASSSAPTPATAATASISVHDLFARASETGHSLLGRPTKRSMSVCELEDEVLATPAGAVSTSSSTSSATTSLSQAVCGLSSPPTSCIVDGAVTSSASSLYKLVSRPPPPLTARPPTSGVKHVPLKETADVDRIHQLFGGVGAGVVGGSVFTATTSDAATESPAVTEPIATSPSVQTSGLALMPPAMFAVSATDEPSAAAAPAKNTPSVDASGSLAATTAAAKHADCGDVTPLTQRQLAQALNFLLRHDAGFVERLHEAYVQSLTERFQRSV